MVALKVRKKIKNRINYNILPISLLQVFLLLKSIKSEGNYLVGGCVRDMLTNISPKDYDLVTEIPINDLEELFVLNKWKVDTVGKSFLVLRVSKGNDCYEIANYRSEEGFQDGRRPEVVIPSTIKEDANRRDFTVNSLYLCPFSGEIIDFNNGLFDLKNKELRFVGNPKKRIQEDYLRVFRFYRFLKKGFKPNKASLRACREMFAEACGKTSADRILREIEQMVCLR